MPADLRWREALRDAVRDPHELCRRLGLPSELADRQAEAGFATLVPPGFLSRIRPGDPADPLLRQVLPAAAEGGAADLPLDAVGDLAAQKAPGLLHKYRGRALIVTAGQCAVNCRYCFRRHFPYQDAPRSEADWDAVFSQIEGDPTIHEVILSGGDPLVLSDSRLRWLVERVEAIPHLGVLRVHSRLPIVVPERVTSELADLFGSSRLPVVFVLHTNHANEIDGQLLDATRRLKQACSQLLNQSVLLRGVNDSVDALYFLSRRLLEAGVLPYYLHQLDRVAGVTHFEVPVEEGLALVEQLRARLPGYAVPRYVREEPGAPNKTVLA